MPTGTRRSQSHDVVGCSTVFDDNGEQQQQQSDAALIATQWWLNEAKRMRTAAVKMRGERDRFRTAVEDAHVECRRLSSQVQELQSQLRHTQELQSSQVQKLQTSLRESKSMADAARHELERLRHWIDEAHEESRRLSADVQEYEWQLHECRLTLTEAERSCEELKDENEMKDSELVMMREEFKENEAMGAEPQQRDRFKLLQLDLGERRAEVSEIRSVLKATNQKLTDEQSVTESLTRKLRALQSRSDSSNDGYEV